MSRGPTNRGFEIAAPLRVLIALALVAGLLVAGCGGDNGGEGGGDGEPSAEETAPADPDASGGENADGDPDPAAGGDAGGDAADVEQVARDYMTAVANGDGEAACALLSDDGVAELRQAYAELEDEPPTCPEIIEFMAALSEEGAAFQVGGRSIPLDQIPDAELEVELADGEAEVRLAGQPQGITLKQVDGRWVIGPVSG